MTRRTDTADARHYPRRPLVAASAAVFRGGCVLVARRAVSPARGLWSLPGGLVEPGERLAEAAAREVAEETGVSAEMLAPADVVEVVCRDADGGIARHYVIVAFAALWSGGEARPGEATDAVRWIALNELDDLALTNGTAAVIRKAAALAGDA